MTLPNPCVTTQSPAPTADTESAPEPQSPAAASGHAPSEPVGGIALYEGTDQSEPDDQDEGEWEEVGDVGLPPGDVPGAVGAKAPRTRRRRRQPKLDSPEFRLRGRRALCKRIEDIAPLMLKMVKLRVVTSYLPSVRGLEDDDLTRILRDDAAKIAERGRVLAALTTPDADFNRSQLKAMILDVLLQEEVYALPEKRLDEKVIEFEAGIVERSKSLDLTDLRKSDPDRWHHFDTYRIVLEAAWSNDGMISPDEARLLAVLRTHLSISREEHWLISGLLKRFPKEGCALHTPDEVNDARKELQRQGVLWQYRDENNQNVDVIPAEVAETVRRDHAGQELQRVNFRRVLSHDGILLTDLRAALVARGLDRAGNKAELIERVVASEVTPADVLGALDRDKLSAMCGSFGLKSAGAKADLVRRLIEFYDDLTFEERATKDVREGWYADYELLAARAYAELRAKKVITKDLDIQYLFEDATAFLFEARMRAACDVSRRDNRADGRLALEADQSLLWDCKSAEVVVNLQDHLDTQFDGYLRKEREAGRNALGFLVIGPAFTPQSLILANRYKARTNWDVALVTASGLKHLADRWAALEPDKPFPIRLLNRTEVIDKERAEFLLSLA
ncbi:SAP domain-containing protein [Gemmata sp.]|uniref:SAP domain-containing protein n=1 Tax=Gemmata sp. TaxID=1914242 RepID=UPI003F729573